MKQKAMFMLLRFLTITNCFVSKNISPANFYKTKSEIFRVSATKIDIDIKYFNCPNNK